MLSCPSAERHVSLIKLWGSLAHLHRKMNICIRQRSLRQSSSCRMCKAPCLIDGLTGWYELEELVMLLGLSEDLSDVVTKKREGSSTVWTNTEFIPTVDAFGGTSRTCRIDSSRLSLHNLLYGTDRLLVPCAFTPLLSGRVVNLEARHRLLRLTGNEPHPSMLHGIRRWKSNSVFRTR